MGGVQWVDGDEVEDVRLKRQRLIHELIHRGLLGDDRPPFLPLTLEQEESVHFTPEAPGGKDEWRSERFWDVRGTRDALTPAQRQQRVPSASLARRTSRASEHRFSTTITAWITSASRGWNSMEPRTHTQARRRATDHDLVFHWRYP